MPFTEVYRQENDMHRNDDKRNSHFQGTLALIAETISVARFESFLSNSMFTSADNQIICIEM